MIETLKQHGIEIRVDTASGYDPDTGIIYPLKYEDIVFPTKEEEIPIEEEKIIIDTPRDIAIKARAKEIMEEMLKG